MRLKEEKPQRLARYDQTLRGRRNQKVSNRNLTPDGPTLHRLPRVSELAAWKGFDGVQLVYQRRTLGPLLVLDVFCVYSCDFQPLSQRYQRFLDLQRSTSVIIISGFNNWNKRKLGADPSQTLVRIHFTVREPDENGRTCNRTSK